MFGQKYDSIRAPKCLRLAPTQCKHFEKESGETKPPDLPPVEWQQILAHGHYWTESIGVTPAGDQCNCTTGAPDF
jgi:hypothetical protein